MGTLLFNRFQVNGSLVKTVIEGGRKWLVAPLTLINPGVLAGSQGPLMYTAEQTSRAAHKWNRIPLVVYHPTDPMGRHVSANSPGILAKSGIGHIRKPIFDGKLRAEGWFDADRTRAVDKRVHDALVNGQQIELSTGLFTDNRPAPQGANHNGRPYSYLAENHVPDHLAILPDQVGACSNRDGCGVLVNQARIKESAWLEVNSNPDGCNQYKGCGTGGSKYGQVTRAGKPGGVVHEVGKSTFVSIHPNPQKEPPKARRTAKAKVEVPDHPEAVKTAALLHGQHQERAATIKASQADPFDKMDQHQASFARYEKGLEDAGIVGTQTGFGFKKGHGPAANEWLPAVNANPEGCNQYKDCAGGSEENPILKEMRDSAAPLYKEAWSKGKLAGTDSKNTKILSEKQVRGLLEKHGDKLTGGSILITGVDRGELSAGGSFSREFGLSKWSGGKYLITKITDNGWLPVENAFCATGQGNGQDNSCSSHGAVSAKLKELSDKKSLTGTSGGGSVLGAANVVADALKTAAFPKDSKITKDAVAAILDENHVVGTQSGGSGYTAFKVHDEKALKTLMAAALTGKHEGKPVLTRTHFDDLARKLTGNRRSKMLSDNADYPWDECIADQQKAGHSDESAAKICGYIKAKNNVSNDWTEVANCGGPGSGIPGPCKGAHLRAAKVKQVAKELSKAKINVKTIEREVKKNLAKDLEKKAKTQAKAAKERKRNPFASVKLAGMANP